MDSASVEVGTCVISSAFCVTGSGAVSGGFAVSLSMIGIVAGSELFRSGFVVAWERFVSDKSETVSLTERVVIVSFACVLSDCTGVSVGTFVFGSCCKSPNTAIHRTAKTPTAALDFSAAARSAF